MLGAVWLSSGVSGLFTAGKAIASASPDIAVIKGSPGAGTRAAVELLGGMKQFVKPGNRVLIKPNMSFPVPPERASNTHPEVVRELAVMCKEAGASKIIIPDHTLSSPEDCLKSSGIADNCKNVDPGMVFSTNDDELYKEVSIPDAVTMNKTDILKDFLNSDVLIAAPVAKSHSSTGVSLSMKGMMGLIYNRGIMHWRYNLSKSIVDICTIFKADLTVVDGSRVLSTNGPRGPGKVLKENTIIASKDMVAADAYAVSAFEWYGQRFRPDQVEHIKEAHNRGLGRMDIENMMVKTVTL